MPPFTCGSAAVIGAKKQHTRPAMVSAIASGVPLYGTCVTSMPVASLSFSTLRCVPLPMPAEAKLSSPGFAFASATKSASVLQPDCGPTISTFGWPASGAMLVKSFSVSYGSLA